jgi:hypothetical protein
MAIQPTTGSVTVNVYSVVALLYVMAVTHIAYTKFKSLEDLYYRESTPSRTEYHQ